LIFQCAILGICLEKATLHQSLRENLELVPDGIRGASNAAQPTVTLKQIGVQLAETHEMPKRQVEALFADMIDAIVKQMKKGAKVRISGLGILQAKKRAARMGRNPATGEAIKIKASKKVAFRVAKDLKV
jgi:DNA-binding protein HU-beta